jgi:hypothetical protein
MTSIHKQKAWREANQWARLLTDKLGTPVDKEIVQTVAVFRLLGFNTVGSCGGHIRRVTSGPYVIFESLGASKYATMARKISDKKDKHYIASREKANYSRAVELRRLVDYIEAFYQERPIDSRRHLIVQSMPMTLNILQCQGAEIALAVNSEVRKQILKNNQAEIAAFTRFLKDQSTS